MYLRLFSYTLISICLYSCASTKDTPKYILTDGKYSYKQPGEDYRKVYVYVTEEDSVNIFSDAAGKSAVKPQIHIDEYFIKQSLDIDVVAMPFKFRPASVNLPRQLTYDFNGSIYFGYRVDRFRLIHKQTPVGARRFYKHRGLTVGAFGGLGSAQLTPWTTNYQMNDEYVGMVICRGVAVMVGTNNLTFGIGVGWDYLTDRDKDIWIYQNKRLYGVTIGLNLN